MSGQEGQTRKGARSRLALVLGATGGIGGEIAQALDRTGWSVRALARDPAKVAAKNGYEWVAGDALDGASVARAAKGAALIVHAVNPPGYRDWDRLVLPMIDNSLAAARTEGARLVLPGKIYNYGSDAFPILHEDSPQNPATRKGAIRVAMEQRLGDSGQPCLILRAGDYFGPRPGNSWFSQALVKPGQKVTYVTYPGKQGVGHAWAYLPDVAATFAALVAREQDLPRFARFHFGGHWDADGTMMVQAIGRAVGRPAMKIRSLPWLLFALVAPFNPTIREMLEMKPFWRTAVRLDGKALESFLGDVPLTRFDDAVKAALQGIGATNVTPEPEPSAAGTAGPHRLG